MSNPHGSHHSAAPGSPLPRPLRFLGRPLSAVYASVIARRNRYWERHAPARVDRPVISVGNLSAGGTGKTPMVSWLASQLAKAGHQPAIAMRGYKAGRDQKSDEQLEHEARLATVPVLADPDRFAAITRYLHLHADTDVILLDDGFQHRQLHRDLDIVLIDALRSPFDDAVLPRGYLREPVSNLARAHVIALTRTDLLRHDALGALRSEISQIAGEPPRLEFRSVWTRVDSSDADQPRDVNWLKDRTFVALCGIGHPDAFLAMAGRAGAQLTDTIILRDHATYHASMLKEAARQAANTDGILTTAKDWTKIEPLLKHHRLNAVFHRPRLDFEPERGGEWLIARINKIIRQRTENV